MASFLEKVTKRITEKDTVLCVGIDPPFITKQTEGQTTTDLSSLYTWCINIIKETAPYVCCFKPNVAFFEQYGPGGMEVLRRICEEIPPDIPTILDVKRAATGEAAEAYAHAFFNVYKADCITLDPYLGREGLSPFVNKEKGVFVVCKSSNPSGPDVQGFRVCEGLGFRVYGREGVEVYRQVAELCEQMRLESDEKSLIGLVMGATYPEEMKLIRDKYPYLWFLSPGVGAQGGDLKETLKAGLREDGLGLIVAVGRGVANAPSPAKAAEELRNKMRDLIKQIKMK